MITPGWVPPKRALLPLVIPLCYLFYLQQNGHAYLPLRDQRAAVSHAIGFIFNSTDLYPGLRRLRKIVDEITGTRSKLAAWIEENLPQGLVVFNFPMACQRRLRTTTALEHVSIELNSCTRVAGNFPNKTPFSCACLAHFARGYFWSATGLRLVSFFDGFYLVHSLSRSWIAHLSRL